MPPSAKTMAEQIAQAATAFQEQRTGHEPRSVSVVLSDDTPVVTLHEALTPAETALLKDSRGRCPRSGVSLPAFRRLSSVSAAEN